MGGEGSSFGSAGGAWTVGSLWHDIAGRQLGDELLEWAPDLFAFTDVVLDRSEAFRFAVSPPDGTSWPPSEMSDWYLAIADASAGWCAWVDGDGTKLPGLVAGGWAVVREHSATTLDELATGRAWRICQALLTLHAIADEACAGTGVAVADVPRDGARFRARARELLARTGTLSRISRQRLRVLGVWFGGRWWRYRQNKHHRWSLDDNQIDQYHLGAALSPGVRWWEAMAVPRRAVQVVELDDGVTLVSLVCEDLARLDEVAGLLRAIGPTLVVTTLLDGPQLASRWTARYASVLADDPGSAVVTLTSFGFVQRSRPAGRPPSRVVSLWKDPVRGLREIPLEAGAHAVLIHIQIGRTTRHSADGRRPVANTADVRAEGVRQIRALDPGDHTGAAMPGAPVDHQPAVSLQAADLTILTSWAEAVVEALAASPDQLTTILDDARAGAPWRRQFGVAEPSAGLASALEDLAQMVVSGTSTVEAVLAAMDERPRGGDHGHLVRAVLRSKLGPGYRE